MSGQPEDQRTPRDLEIELCKLLGFSPDEVSSITFEFHPGAAMVEVRHRYFLDEQKSKGFVDTLKKYRLRVEEA